MDGAILQAGLVLLILFAGGYLAKRIGQSVIPAYILIGLLIGGFIPKGRMLDASAEAGLALLLFFIGLEFSFSSLLFSLKRTVLTGAVDFVFSFPAGIAFGLLMGANPVESVYLGAILYMSSTAIITKTLTDSRLSAYPEAEPMLRILVFEDLLIAVFLALFQGIKSGVSPVEGAALSLAKAAGFFLVLSLLFKWGRRGINRVFSVDSQELFIMLGLGFVLVVSGVASLLEISPAVGAFLAGALFSETMHKVRMEESLSPLKDLLTGVFFLSFGVKAAAGGMEKFILPAVAFTLLGLITKVSGGQVIGRMERLSDRASLGLGIGLVARGEFSIIIAAMLPEAPIGPGAVDLRAMAALFILFSGISGAVAMREFPKAWFWWTKRGGRGR